MLSFLRYFSAKRVWLNYDSEFRTYMLLQQHSIYQCYHYIDVINLFSRSYFTSYNKKLLKNLIAAKVSISDIDALFSDEEQVDRLNSVNQDLLKLLINKSVVIGKDYGHSIGFSLFALKNIYHNKFDLGLFRTEKQVH